MIDAIEALLGPRGQESRFYGVTIGIVRNTDDRAGLGRVKVRFPWLADDEESAWARVVAPMAGNGRGAYFPPEVDDEVLVAFEHGRPEFPYILGALWNGKDKLPCDNQDGKNNIRVIKSRSGHIIRLDDTDGGEKIEIIDKTGQNSITIDAAAKTLTIAADGDIAIKSANGKVTLSGKGIELASQAGIKAEATAGLDLKADAQLTIKGQVVNIN
jgi:uncharacterized protein involved in type VI secretion and phage assembly